MIDLVRRGILSGTMAKDVFNEMVSTGRNACEIVKERGAEQISDEEMIRSLAVGIVAGNPAEARKYRQGKTGHLGFFVGRLMSATDGKGEPQDREQDH
jgi:aspartyl-tRNA(Asn)/glutamyl-tRNA(Gln) amidotransferase subunit B